MGTPQRLTNARIEATHHETWLSDNDGTHGHGRLLLRVTRSGARLWYFRYFKDGAAHTVPLLPWSRRPQEGHLTLEQARKEANRLSEALCAWASGPEAAPSSQHVVAPVRVPGSVRRSAAAVLRDFQSLPDIALVPVQIVEALYCVSNSTVWRWVESGEVPEPVHIGGVVRWKVGRLRQAMKDR